MGIPEPSSLEEGNQLLAYQSLDGLREDTREMNTSILPWLVDGAFFKDGDEEVEFPCCGQEGSKKILLQRKAIGSANSSASSFRNRAPIPSGLWLNQDATWITVA